MCPVAKEVLLLVRELEVATNMSDDFATINRITKERRKAAPHLRWRAAL